MKKLNIAIIGTGRIGQRHASHIYKLANLTAVCDINNKLAQDIALKYHCRSYNNIGDLLGFEKSVDVVAICTPNGMHAKHTILSLKAGKHVLCEKPMAITVKDCEQMITEAEKANKRLFIVKQNRFNPPIVALKKALYENRLGKIISIQVNCFWNRNRDYYLNSDWKGTKKLDGGTLFTQFSHFIDIVYWLIGDVRTVYAITKNQIHKDIIEFEDSGVIALEFENGALGTIHYTVNSFNKNMEGSITVFGEKGTIKVGGQYLNTLEYQEIENFKIPQLEESKPPNDYGNYQGSMSNHEEVYENLIAVLSNNGVIATNGLEGLKTIQIIEKIYYAAGKVI